MADLNESPVDQLRGIVARLRAPGGCPWDREQTHASLRSGLIEEAYEVVEAIDRNDDAHFREELGDLLLQVIMHSQIASEQGRFDFDAVAGEVAEKLVRRHPHVFGDTKLGDSEAVLQQWEEIKTRERAAKGDAPARASVLDGISSSLPALMRAEKVQKRVARVGFDWSDLSSVVAKIREELLEVEREIAAAERDRLAEELGDLLFTVVNLTRKAKFEAELLLAHATNKFIERFRAVEDAVAGQGKAVTELPLPELDAIWDQVKRR
jgi:MazG family protein